MSSYNELLEENKNLKFEIHKLKKEIEKLKSYISTNDNRQTITNHSININSTLKEKIKLYRSLFHGRNDVFALRWDNESKNTHGYKPYCINEWKHGICNKSEVKCSDCDFRKFKSLEDKDIVDHLSGQKTIGLYPLLSNELLNLIKRTAVFSNPEYYTRQAMRLSVYKTPKTINGFDEYGKYLILLRGLSQEVYKIFEDNKVKVNIQDKRISGMNIDVAFNGKLYAYT